MAITSLAVNENIILTGSRDGTIKVRHRSNDNGIIPSENIYTYYRHDNSEIVYVDLESGTNYALSLDGQKLKKWMIDIDELYKALEKRINKE